MCINLWPSILVLSGGHLKEHDLKSDSIANTVAWLKFPITISHIEKSWACEHFVVSWATKQMDDIQTVLFCIIKYDLKDTKKVIQHIIWIFSLEKLDSVSSFGRGEAVRSKEIKLGENFFSKFFRKLSRVLNNIFLWQNVISESACWTTSKSE